MFVLSCAVVGGVFAEGIQFIVILYNVFGRYVPEGYIHHILYSLSEVQYLLSVLVDIAYMTWGLSVVYVCTNHKLVHTQNMYLPV